MSEQGLRAWIGQVEWKLGRRTRVFLALAVIAVGAAGAAIFLAIDAQNSAVSEGDVQALQKELEAQIVGGGGAGAAALETKVEELETRLKELEDAQAGGSGTGGGGTSGGQSGGSSNGGSGGGDSQGAAEQGTGTSGSNQDLQDFLNRAKEQQK